MAQRLPLIPSEPNYRFQTEFDEVSFFVDVRWNERDEAWYMDVLDEDEVRVLSGLKLVLGALPGIRSADPRRPNGVFVVSDLSGQSSEAGFDDMGDRVVVSFFTAEELLTA